MRYVTLSCLRVLANMVFCTWDITVLFNFFTFLKPEMISNIKTKTTWTIIFLVALRGSLRKHRPVGKNINYAYAWL